MSFVQLPVSVFRSKLILIVCTYALLDVLFFVLAATKVIIEHCFEIGIMTLVARTLVIDSVGEKSVETETDEIGLTHLNESKITSEFE